jgi:50S ribosomal protein L16 3-hydroxylase
MQFNSFDSAAFLRDHWQKRPALIRGAWAEWRNPLAPDELAGLACEEGIEARLIAGNSGRLAAEHGPFAEARFGELGAGPWTLLVQAVDHHVAEVAALLGAFRFVPNWRIDDVMVSYASDGGGVGPHFDQYDVFLIQGLGRRRWQVGARCDSTTPLLPHDDLRLLADFTATNEWLLEPGDILYVPPGFAHNGVAVGDDCMTYSIGFRAPSRSELIAGWCDEVLAGLDDDDRYADPELAAQSNSGEIAAAALSKLHAMVMAKLGDQAAFARWFGEHASARKYPEIDWAPDEPITVEALREALASGAALARNPASRFSFVRGEGDAVLLFVDGECLDCAGEVAVLAEQLCAGERIEVAAGLVNSGAAMELLARLFNQGSVEFEAED